MGENGIWGGLYEIAALDSILGIRISDLVEYIYEGSNNFSVFIYEEDFRHPLVQTFLREVNARVSDTFTDVVIPKNCDEFILMNLISSLKDANNDTSAINQSDVDLGFAQWNLKVKQYEGLKNKRKSGSTCETLNH
jgi:hypothetical protein